MLSEILLGMNHLFSYLLLNSKTNIHEIAALIRLATVWLARTPVGIR
jgi:hypothetical protein